MPISGNELLVLLVLAAFLIGPERLPEYAEQVARLVRGARRYISGARTRIRSELGPDFDDVDWTQFDPRRYDPRRIVRDALLEDDKPAARMQPIEVAGPGAAVSGNARPAADVAPFDDEAT